MGRLNECSCARPVVRFATSPTPIRVPPCWNRATTGTNARVLIRELPRPGRSASPANRTIDATTPAIRTNRESVMSMNAYSERNPSNEAIPEVTPASVTLIVAKSAYSGRDKGVALHSHECGAAEWGIRASGRALLRAASAVAAILTLATAGCGRPVKVAPEKALVQTTIVQPLTNTHYDSEASYLAYLRFDQETDLSFKVGGILESIGPIPGTDWDEGTPVTAGSVLAELKQSDFTNALISARARADLMNKQVERFRRLRATDAISQQELDVIEADWRTSQAQLDQAEQNLRDSRLVAAKDGVVLTRHVNSRVTVAPGQRVLRFADTSLVSVELGLPDRLIGQVTPGREVDVEVSSLEGLPPFKGRISEVGVAATGEGRLFRVVIKVPNPQGILRSGMTARIHVGGNAVVRPGTVCIPLSALLTLPPKSGSEASVATNRLGVFVLQNGRVKSRPVKTGDIMKSSILVMEGLQAGEQVVTSGASFLFDGAAVEVAPEMAAN